MYALSLILLPTVLAAQVRLPWAGITLRCRNQVSHFGLAGATVRPALRGPSRCVVQLCWCQQRQPTKGRCRFWPGLQPLHPGRCALTTRHQLPLLT